MKHDRHLALVLPVIAFVLNAKVNLSVLISSHVAFINTKLGGPHEFIIGPSLCFLELPSNSTTTTFTNFVIALVIVNSSYFIDDAH